MPRRIQIISPDLELNHTLTVRFDDGTWTLVKRDFYGYHARGGRIKFDCETKDQLDQKLSFAGEDRGGIDRIDQNYGVMGVTPDGTHIAEIFANS